MVDRELVVHPTEWLSPHQPAICLVESVPLLDLADKKTEHFLLARALRIAFQHLHGNHDDGAAQGESV